MMCNVGKTEKAVRVILGLIFVWIAWTYSPWWYIVAGILFITAAVGWCPINKTLGINTCKMKEEKKMMPGQPPQQPPQQTPQQ